MAKTITKAVLCSSPDTAGTQPDKVALTVTATVSMPASEWAAFIAPLAGLTDGMTTASKASIAADIAERTASLAAKGL